jgi:hypothetical protein
LQSVNQTVNSASTLLNTWTRILSQTEHNQRLILNHAWQGASQDQADQEQEAYARQQATERRELELPRRSALKMRRGGKRRQLRGVQSLYKEGEEDLREKPQARHSLRRLATCQWVAKAQERFQGVWAVERGAPPKWLWHLPRVSGSEEDEEQELDI